MNVAGLSDFCLSKASLSLVALMLATTELPAPERSAPLEHIEAVLLVIGCFDDLSGCRELPSAVSVYETLQECDQRLPYSLGAFTGQFEQLFAQCFPVDPLLEGDLEVMWQVHPNGDLAVWVEQASPDAGEPADALIALDTEPGEEARTAIPPSAAPHH
jgi:hypothetical protein